jgi:hypothetical protein
MLFGRIKKIKKSKHQNRREKERETQTDKRVKNSFFINQIVVVFFP